MSKLVDHDLMWRQAVPDMARASIDAVRLAKENGHQGLIQTIAEKHPDCVGCDKITFESQVRDDFRLGGKIVDLRARCSAKGKHRYGICPKDLSLGIKGYIKDYRYPDEFKVLIRPPSSFARSDHPIPDTTISTTTLRIDDLKQSHIEAAFLAIGDIRKSTKKVPDRGPQPSDSDELYGAW